MTLPKSWAALLDRLAAALAGSGSEDAQAEAEEWLRQAVTACWGRSSLHDLTRQSRQLAFQRAAGVLLAVEDEGGLAFTLDNREQAAALFARYFRIQPPPGPPWRISPAEPDRPPYHVWRSDPDDVPLGPPDAVSAPSTVPCGAPAVQPVRGRETAGGRVGTSSAPHHPDPVEVHPSCASVRSSARSAAGDRSPPPARPPGSPEASS